MERYQTRVAVYLFLEKEGKQLLMRRFNTGWMDGYYSLLSGHVEKGETAEQAMIREAKEEAGIIVAEEHIDCVHVMHRNSPDGLFYIDIFMKTDTWEGTPKNTEPEKCDHMDWFASFPENTVDYIKEVMQQVKEGIFFSEFGWD